MAEKKIILGIDVRLEFLKLIPKQSSLLKIILIKDLKKKIELTLEEVSTYMVEVKNQNGSFFTLKKLDGTDKKEFIFSEVDNRIIKEILQTASKNEQITESLIELCNEYQIN